MKSPAAWRSAEIHPPSGVGPSQRAVDGAMSTPASSAFSVNGPNRARSTVPSSDDLLSRSLRGELERPLEKRQVGLHIAYRVVVPDHVSS